MELVVKRLFLSRLRLLINTEYVAHRQKIFILRSLHLCKADKRAGSFSQLLKVTRVYMVYI